MFSLLESKKEIATAQRKLEASIARDFTKRAVKNIGYPGGTTYNANVYTDGQYWFYSEDYRTSTTPRRLNWFGLFSKNTDLQISVEINTAYAGRNDQVAGFFARHNDTGSTYLLHSGRVGGGTKGVGKSAFLAWGDQHLIEVADSSGNVREGVLVMPVEGKAATRPAIRYIDTIVRFKQAVRAGETNSREFQSKQRTFNNFYSEPRGRRRGRRPGEIDYLSRHGDIVDALKSWLNSQSLPKGCRLVKNALIDLGIADGKKLIRVYEVKTTAARCDIYTAIGQVMVHGNAAKCQRVIVLPQKEPLATDLASALKRLNIDLLKFKLDKLKATIVS